jgi:YhcH/YjgK/YiaL family protein
MIIDTLQNAHLYFTLGNRFKKGFEYLTSTNLIALEPGKYQIADGIFALVSEYQTKFPEDAVPESHIKHADIQYMVTGQEFMGYTPYTGQTPTIAYDNNKDITFYNVPTSLNLVSKGMFTIFFPTDIHQPSVMVNTSETVKKVVIKVEL